METVGSIIDQLCILEKRMQVIDKKGTEFADLKCQRAWLLYSLGKCLVEIFARERPALMNKHKQYDEDVIPEVGASIVELIAVLDNRTKRLWYLEDIRRDDSILDDDRLSAADEVSIRNRERNNVIDRIDKIISDSVNFKR